MDPIRLLAEDLAIQLAIRTRLSAGGYFNKATGTYATVAGGNTNTASGDDSAVAGGALNTASGSFSLAANFTTTSESYAQSTFGQYNVLTGGNATAWDTADVLFAIGKGTSAAARSNAMTVLKSGNVGIGTTTPNAALDVAVAGGSSAIIVPRDTQSNRPSAGVNGMIRYNTSTSKFEAFESNAWTNMIGTGGATQWNNGASSSINYTAGAVGVGTASIGSNNFAQFENGGGKNFVIDGNGTGVWTGIGTEPITSFHVLSSDTTWGGVIFENSDNATTSTFTTLNTARQVKTVGAGVGTSFVMQDSTPELAEYGYFGAIIEGNTAGSQSGSLAFFPSRNGSRTEALRMTSAGRVGIGTTTPKAALDVALAGGSSAIIVPRDTQGNRPSTGVNGMIRYNTSTSKFEAFENNSWSNMIASAGGTSAGNAKSIQVSDGSGGFLSNNNVVVNTSTGYLGIGTSSPQFTLDVNRDAGGFSDMVRIRNQNAAGSSSILYVDSDDTIQAYTGYGNSSIGAPYANTFFFATGSKPLSFFTNETGSGDGTARMTIKPTSGNVGIGTTSPTRLLDVAGPIHITPAALPSSPAAGELAFDSGSANALKFYNGSAWQTVTTGLAGLANFTESVNTSAPNATVPVVRLLATNAATDVDIALSPKGAGALTAHVADGLANGGNKRGSLAVDWQHNRALASQVASGSSSTIGGGSSNQASNTYSTVGGGFYNIASGNSSTISGGQLNTASGDFSFAANFSTTSQSYVQTTFGQFNVLTGGNTIGWVTSDPLFVIGNGTAAGSRSNAVTVLKNGNVGIGITTPNHLLTVGANGQSTATISARAGASNTFEWGHSNPAGYGSTLGYGASNGRPFIALSGEAGTTANTFMSRGIKSSIIQSDAAGGFIFGTVASASADNQSLLSKVTIDVSGNLSAAGTVTSSTAMYSPAFYYTSDRRLKENIQEIENPLDKLLALRGVTFDWRSNQQKDMGFIAQEVEKVLPDMVKERPDKKFGTIKTVKYGNIVSLTVEAIKELWHTLTNHEDRLEKLEKENLELKQKLESLERRIDKLGQERAPAAADGN